MIAGKKILTFSKWCALGLFALFLIGNIVLALRGVVSILLFSVIITLTFLFAETILKITRVNSKTRHTIRILIISIFTGILLGEIMLRVWGKYDSYREQKGDFFYNFIYDKTRLDKNTLFEIFDQRLSMTNPAYNAEFELKSKDEFRILGMGDSFTEGVGASNDSTWLTLLATKLNENTSGKRIRTFNAGVSGNDPFFEYILLKEKLLDYKPDLVLVALNNSDISETIVRGGMERFQPDSTIVFKEGPWFETLFGMSYICRVFVIEVLKYDWLFLTEAERKREETVALDKIHSCILKFGQLAKDKDLEILLIFHPMIEEVVSGNFSFNETMEKLSNEPHLETLDMLDYYQNKGNMNQDNVGDFYWEFDKHHNARGYEVFAKGVERKIMEMNYLGTFAD